MQLCCPSKVIVILTYNQSVVMIHYNKDPRRAANICFVTMSPYPQALKCLFEFKFPPPTWFPMFPLQNLLISSFSLLTLISSLLNFFPFHSLHLLLHSLLQYPSCWGLPCMASLHSNANNASQLWLSMPLCLCLQELIQRHIVSGEIWVSQCSIPSGTASSI